MVFADGSVKGQLAAPDMRLPIGYALAYPARLSAQPADGQPETEIHMLGGNPGEEPAAL